MVRSILVVATALMAAGAAVAQAREHGPNLLDYPTVPSCGGCHSAGAPGDPAVRLERIDGEEPLTPNARARFRVAISGGPARACGFGSQVSGGFIASGGAGSTVGESGRTIAHTDPKPFPTDGGPCAFEFDVVPDGSTETLVITVFGNSVNRDGWPDHDRWNRVAATFPVIPPRRLQMSPSSLSPATLLAGGATADQSIEVSSARADAIAYTIACDQPWVAIDPPAGVTSDTPVVHRVRYDRALVAALGPGVHPATITATAPDASNPPQQVAIALKVEAGDLVRTELATPTSGIGFGASVGVGQEQSSDWIVVGAPYDAGTGAAYAYRRTLDGWELFTILRHPHLLPDARFGVTLGFDVFSGLWIGTDVQQAFAFRHTTTRPDGVPTTRWFDTPIFPDNAFPCSFRERQGCGVSIAHGLAAVTGSTGVDLLEPGPFGWERRHVLSFPEAAPGRTRTAHEGALGGLYAGDGAVLAMSSFERPDSLTTLGSVLVHEALGPTSGPHRLSTAIELRELVPPGEIRADTSDRFGSAVATFREGGLSRVLVGDNHDDDDVGAVHIFQKRDALGIWLYRLTLRPPEGDTRVFGSVLALRGNRAVVGAHHRLYVYDFDGLDWHLRSRQDDLVNHALAMSDTSIVVGGSGDTVTILEPPHEVEFDAAPTVTPVDEASRRFSVHGGYPTDSLGHDVFSYAWQSSCPDTRIFEVADAPIAAVTLPACISHPSRACTITMTATDLIGKSASTSVDIVPNEDPLADADADGLSLLRELQLGSDPCNADTDGDGSEDGEDAARGGDPTRNESDDDGVPDAVDNCPGAKNPDQSDLDRDLLGNACDPEDAGLEIRHVRLRKNTGARRANGSLMVSGDIVLASPDDAFDPSSGLAMEVVDELGVRESIAFTADQCRTLRSGRVTCRSADGAFKQLVQPLSARDGHIRFRLRLRQRGSTGAIGDALTLRLAHGPGQVKLGLDRVGTLGRCQATDLGMSCRAADGD